MNELAESFRCVICDEPATCYPVRTGRSWFDGVWFLSWINTLQAMPRRYAIEENWQAKPKYCATCRGNAESKLNEAHSSIRAEHAAFNAAQQQKLSALDHGGLDQSLRRDFDAILDRMGIGARVVVAPRQLEQPASNVHVMPVASTGGE
jgi:hypothetical protein